MVQEHKHMHALGSNLIRQKAIQHAIATLSFLDLRCRVLSLKDINAKVLHRTPHLGEPAGMSPCKCKDDDDDGINAGTRICKVPAWMPRSWLIGQVSDQDEEDMHDQV